MPGISSSIFSINLSYNKFEFLLYLKIIVTPSAIAEYNLREEYDNLSIRGARS